MSKMAGIHRLIEKQIQDAEEFIERSLELAERFSNKPEAEERFLQQAINHEERLNDFKAGKIEWM